MSEPMTAAEALAAISDPEARAAIERALSQAKSQAMEPDPEWRATLFAFPTDDNSNIGFVSQKSGKDAMGPRGGEAQPPTLRGIMSGSARWSPVDRCWLGRNTERMAAALALARDCEWRVVMCSDIVTARAEAEKEQPLMRPKVQTATKSVVQAGPSAAPIAAVDAAALLRQALRG